MNKSTSIKYYINKEVKKAVKSLLSENKVAALSCRLFSLFFMYLNYTRHVLELTAVHNAN